MAIGSVNKTDIFGDEKVVVTETPKNAEPPKDVEELELKPQEKWFINFKNKLKSPLQLTLWIFSYFVFLSIGGFCIKLIEEDNDRTLKNTQRENLLAVLEKYNFTSNNTMVKEIIKAAVKVYSVKGLYLDNLEAEVDTTWTWSGGLFFSATLVTTIGEILFINPTSTNTFVEFFSS